MTCLIHTGRRHWRPGITAMGVCLLLALTAGHALPAAEGPARQTIDLNRALHNTLQGNADLKTWPYQLRISDGELLQAELRPLPTLGLTVENVLGSGLYTGTDLAEVTLTLGQLVELGDKRDSRVSYATASMAQRQAAYEMARLDVLAETSRRYYELLRVQALQGWIGRRMASEGEALAVIKRRARAGATGQADVSSMQLRLSRSDALATRLQGRAALARMELSAMWAAQPAFTHAAGELLSFPAMPDTARLRAGLENAPAMQLEQTLQGLADAQIRLAGAQGKVDLELGVGLRHFELSHDQALVFGISAPIPIRNPNSGRIAAAQAAKALSIEQMELRRTRLELALASLEQTLRNHHRQAEVIRDQLLPQARKLLADTENAYLKGRYTVLQWVDAQTELYGLERELIETHVLVYLQILELERITGQSLVPALAGRSE